MTEHPPRPGKKPGEFEKAVETQQKAIDDPEFMKDEGEAARQWLKLYRDKKPFRDE